MRGPTHVNSVSTISHASRTSKLVDFKYEKTSPCRMRVHTTMTAGSQCRDGQQGPCCAKGIEKRLLEAVSNYCSMCVVVGRVSGGSIPMLWWPRSQPLHAGFRLQQGRDSF